MAQSLKDTIIEAARAAGAIIETRFGSSYSIQNKEGVNNLVTEIDTMAEAAIIDVVRRHHPDHAFLAEESGEQHTESEYTWIIDPIDGTMNFTQGIPLCCTSIAVQKGSELLAGVIYNPMMNEFFFAEKGKGATLNGESISVSPKEDFARACLVTGFPYHWPHAEKEHPIRTFERFIMRGTPVRRLGSAALDLAWTACGRFDGFWEYNLSPWDIAAGYLLVREAGGRVTDFEGAEADVMQRQTLATNGKIHDEMVAFIKAGNTKEA
jgi:myo-inositol-1(or 4)-monophosphatase